VDITEVARRSGVPASTLRFYEEKGLIASITSHSVHRTAFFNAIALRTCVRAEVLSTTGSQITEPPRS
jgi:hypothetical protein